MILKKFTMILVGLGFFLTVGLYGSLIYSAEALPKGSKIPDFELKGPASPQTKAYLGVNNEKQFSLSQIKTKLVFVEFFDTY
ncbi:MAG: hypothetical protein HY787_17130 [Deltaproteobacteria bacterium]|nr:hypothetical protein [Deltaproteobacteria bacterium]